MIKKLNMFLFLAATIGCLAYFIREALLWSTGEFIATYLDNPSKYFIFVCFYLIPFIFALREPYLSASLREKYGKKLFGHVAVSSIVWTLCFCAWIMLLYFGTALFIGRDHITASYFIFVLSRLFTVAFSYIIMYHVFYNLTGKEIISVCIPYTIGLLYLLALSLADERFNFVDKNEMLLLLIYCIVLLVFGLAFLAYRLGRKKVKA